MKIVLWNSVFIIFFSNNHHLPPPMATVKPSNHKTTFQAQYSNYLELIFMISCKPSIPPHIANHFPNGRVMHTYMIIMTYIVKMSCIAQFMLSIRLVFHLLNTYFLKKKMGWAWLMVSEQGWACRPVCRVSDCLGPWCILKGFTSPSSGPSMLY